MPFVDDWMHPIRPTTKELTVPMYESTTPNGHVRPMTLVDRKQETKEYYHADPRKWLN